VFEAIVTGVNDNGVFARLLSLPAEGRVVQRHDGMDVGERVQVRLVEVNAQKGFIDFAGVSR
jgi:exoribonuclease-2